MNKIFISDSVQYVGADDTTLDLFESQYKIPKGVSYNSYVILDEKITIMDTVDKRASKEWMHNVQDALGDKLPTYLVVSHMEPDHAANIQWIMETYPNIKVIGNAKTFSMIPQFFDIDLTDRKIEVKEGDVVPIGKHSLQFFMAPMVHWPEVMVTYEQTEKILFSADGFGKFGALAQDEDWTPEARRYYINIVGKYGAPVQALLKKAATLDIKMICPLHGPILKEDLGFYIDKYNTWSSYQPEEKGILVAYASIHGNTANAAAYIAELLEKKGEKNVALCDLSREDMSQAVAEAFQYDRMVLACATYDAGLFPPMEDFLNHLRSKNYQKRTVGLVENGSWAPTAAKQMRAVLEQMKDITVYDETVTIKSVMKNDTKEAMNTLADRLVQQ